MDKESDGFVTSANTDNEKETKDPEAIVKLSADSGEPQKAGSVEFSENDAVMNEKPDQTPHPETANAENSDEAQQPSPAGACPSCGAPLIEGASYCGSCGAKVGNTEPIPANSKKNKNTRVKLIIGIAVAIVVCVVIAVFAVPAITITPQQLVARGDFEKAYNKASDDQKQEVLVANLATVCSKDLIEDLNDPDSYRLRSLYFDADSGGMVLEVSASNEAGGLSTSWYYYRYNKEKKEYQLDLGPSTFEDEIIYETQYTVGGKTIHHYHETAESLVRKMLENNMRERMRKLVTDNNEISSDYVDSINELHETDNGFKNVELVESIVAIYPSDSDV